MAGLYIHIPFCRKVCYYCDFHFTVSLKRKDEILSAMIRELESRSESPPLRIETLYFGGGTPSVLSPAELEVFFTTIDKYYGLDDQAEISLEANPDDLSSEYLADLKKYTPINRLSIGIQAFQDKYLQLMNRRHTGKEARQCIENSLTAGFVNLNIDLIYGIPGLSREEWTTNLEILKVFPIPHLSAYHLSFEPKTVFNHYLKKGKLKEIEEEESLAQYELLLDITEAHDYENYEISNFAKAKKYSKHNLGYWQGKNYLGFGPSAHSFDGKMRRWNLSNNSLYLEEMKKGSSAFFETEQIDDEKAFNEYILTALRTKWGISLSFIEKRFGKSYSESLIKKIPLLVEEGLMLRNGEHYFLSRKGKIISNYLITELAMV